MKSLKLIIIGTFLYQALFCQYNKLIEENKYFDIGYYEMGHICGWSDNIYPMRYYFNGDTLINGKHYAKSFFYQMYPSVPGTPCPPFKIDTVKHKGSLLIREDTLSRTVYSLSGVDEELIFDFSLKKGDTLDHNPACIVDTIIDIVTPDNKTRKMFYFNYPSLVDGYYIEGIGGNRGPFSKPIPDFESKSFTMCVKLKNSVVYGSNCYDFVTSVPKNITDPIIKYYPNPSENTLFIVFNELPGSKKLSIVNCNGQLIKHIETKEHSFGLDMSGLKSGIYILKVVIDNKVNKCYPVVKK